MTAPPNTPNSLEQLLVALQKSLSRVSRNSADVPKDQPRSLIVGNVAFHLRTRCAQEGDNRLLVGSEGEIDLELSGTITTDLDAEGPSGGKK